MQKVQNEVFRILGYLPYHLWGKCSGKGEKILQVVELESHLYFCLALLPLLLPFML